MMAKSAEASDKGTFEPSPAVLWEMPSWVEVGFLRVYPFFLLMVVSKGSQKENPNLKSDTGLWDHSGVVQPLLRYLQEYFCYARLVVGKPFLLYQRSGHFAQP